MKLIQRIVAVAADGTEKMVHEAEFTKRGTKLATPRDFTFDAGTDKARKVLCTYDNGFSSGKVGFETKAGLIPAETLGFGYPVRVQGCYMLLDTPTAVAIPKGKADAESTAATTIDGF